MGNETTTTKPPKYILKDGYLYERIPKKKFKEAVGQFEDLQQMMLVASGGKIKENRELTKKVEEMMKEN